MSKFSVMTPSCRVITASAPAAVSFSARPRQHQAYVCVWSTARRAREERATGLVVLNSRDKIWVVVLNSKCTQSKVPRLERGRRAQEEHHSGVRGTEERRRESQHSSVN